MAYIGNTPTTQSFISGTDYFNGTGAQTAFTLSRTVASQNDVEAVVNNVVQQPNAGYTISGTTITFTSAPSAGTQNVYVRYLSTTTQSIAPAQGTVGWSQLNTDTQQDLGISFKNRIINGAMRIDQRNNGASVSVSTSGVYVLDRWKNRASGGGVFSVQQSSTAPSGFNNSALYTVTTADSSIAAGDNYWIIQDIEGFNVADLQWGTANAQTVTISFWVRSSITGTFNVGLTNGTTYDRSYVSTYTINSANTFEYKTITVAGDTTGTWGKTNGGGISLVFNLGAGSTYQATANTWSAGFLQSTSGSTNWIATNGATFYLTGVQLEVGTQATTFTTAGGSYGAELALCQRYYQTFQVSSDWGNASGYGMAAGTFLTQMRSNPTATYTPSSGSILSTSFGAATYQFQLQGLTSGSASIATATFSIEL